MQLLPIIEAVGEVESVTEKQVSCRKSEGNNWNRIPSFWQSQRAWGKDRRAFIGDSFRSKEWWGVGIFKILYHLWIVEWIEAKKNEISISKAYDNHANNCPGEHHPWCVSEGLAILEHRKVENFRRVEAKSTSIIWLKQIDQAGRSQDNTGVFLG